MIWYLSRYKKVLKSVGMHMWEYWMIIIILYIVSQFNIRLVRGVYMAYRLGDIIPLADV